MLSIILLHQCQLSAATVVNLAELNNRNILFFYVVVLALNNNTIMVVRRVNDPKLMRPSCRAFDGLHLNSYGHKVRIGRMIQYETLQHCKRHNNFLCPVILK